MLNVTLSNDISRFITLVKNCFTIDITDFFQSPNTYLNIFLLLSNLLVAVIVSNLFTKYIVNDTSKAQFFFLLLLKKIRFGLVIIAVAIIQTILIKIYTIHDDYFTLKLVQIGVCFIFYKAALLAISYGVPSRKYGSIIHFIAKIMLVLTLLSFITGTEDNIDAILHGIKIPLLGNSYLSIWDILVGIFTILMTVIVSLWMVKFLDSKIYSISSINEGTKQILSRASRIICFTVSILIVLPALGVNITALSVLGGGIGVGIGIGLQRVASNFIGGMIILLDKSVKVGDKIQLDSQNIGYIRRITMRYAVLERSDGTRSLIPNDNFITNVIQSYSYSNAPLLVENILNISISKNDVELVMDILQKALLNLDNIVVAKGVSVTIKTIDIPNDSLALSLQAWVAADSLSSAVKNNMLILAVNTIKAYYIK